MIVFDDFEVHDGADPGEGIGQGAEQSAIAEADMREGIDRVKQRVDLALNECWRVTFGPRNLSVRVLSICVDGSRRRAPIVFTKPSFDQDNVFGKLELSIVQAMFSA